MPNRRIRVALAVALLVALLPAVIAGRQAGAQDGGATPGATPDSGQTGTVAGLETAAIAPADALLYAALTLDPASGQITQSQDLLDRAGLGDLLDQAFAEVDGEMLGASASSDSDDAASDPVDLTTLLDGEAAVVVTDRVLDLLETLAATGADSLDPIMEAAAAPVAAAQAPTPAVIDADDAVSEADPSDPLDNLGSPEADADAGTSTSTDAESDTGIASDTDTETDTTVDSGTTDDSAADDVAVEPVEPGGAAAILRPSDPDAAEETLGTLLLDASRAQDIALDETEVSGIPVTSLPPDEFGGGGAAYARLGDLFVVATNPEDIEPFIAVFADGAPALDADAAFVRARTELPDDFLAFGFINGPAILAAVEPVLAELEDELAAVGLPGSGFGADDLAQVDAYSAFIVRADTPGFRFETATFAADGAELPAIPAGGETTLDGGVPADTLLFVDGFELGATLAPQLDSAALTIAQLALRDPRASALVPEGATEVEQIAAVYDYVGRIIGFNPRTGLIDQMTGEWAFALTVRSLTDPSGIGAVFTSGVDDPTLVTDATTKLAAYLNIVAAALTLSAENPEEILATTEAGTRVEPVDGGLTQVVTIPIPPVSNEFIDTTTGDAATDAPSTGTDTDTDTDTDASATDADAPVPTITLQWGIVDGRFVFGVNEGFDDLVEGAAGGVLTDNPRYQAIMAELPEASNGVFYLDLGQLITLLEPILYGDGFLSDSDAAALPDTDDGLPTPTPSEIEPPDLSGIEAFAAVSYERGDVRGVSALLLIGE